MRTQRPSWEGARRRLAHLLAEAIHLESAREEATPQRNVRDMEAIASAILNRAALERAAGMPGERCERICLKIVATMEKRPAADEDSAPFHVALRIAKRGLAGVLADPTEGATHFHSRDAFPAWAQGRAPTAEIGDHFYYREEA